MHLQTPPSQSPRFTRTRQALVACHTLTLQTPESSRCRPEIGLTSVSGNGHLAAREAAANVNLR